MKNYKAGYVYVITNGIKVKVGRSFNIEKRLRTIETQGGFKISDKYITEINGNYDKCEILSHALLKEHREIGEWFNVSFDVAVRVVKKAHKETYCPPIECDEDSNWVEKFFTDKDKIDSINSDIYSYNWTQEAIRFISMFSLEDMEKIVNVADMVGCVNVMIGDKIHLIYPHGYDVHDKDSYIKQYDKQAIADDIGCGIDDVGEWDDYSIAMPNQSHHPII